MEAGGALVAPSQESMREKKEQQGARGIVFDSLLRLTFEKDVQHRADLVEGSVQAPKEVISRGKRPHSNHVPQPSLPARARRSGIHAGACDPLPKVLDHDPGSAGTGPRDSPESPFARRFRAQGGVNWDRMRPVSLDIASQDARTLLEGTAPAAIYVHVPFCRHKCHYCDFYSLVDGHDRKEAFVVRLEEEIAANAHIIDPRGIRTIFIGGGTPTLLSAEHLERMLLAIRQHFVEPSVAFVEWTIEANPETIDAEKARVIAEGGVTRVSVGCQSFNPRLLKALERHHDPASVPRAVEHLRAAGVVHLNLDLIFGVPGSVLDEWAADLESVLDLAPDHLACYGLTFEPGTPLYEKRRLGRVEEVDDATQMAMYDHTRRTLAAAGYEQYEISNWARPEGRCVHNELYWRNADWLPIGPAAAGHVKGTRWRNLPRLDDWLGSGPFSPIVDREDAHPSRNTGERLMLGFRLTEGLSEDALEEILAEDPLNQRRRQAVLEHGLRNGHLQRVHGHLRFTHSGVLQADGILADLL